MAHLRLSLLGGFQADLDGQPVTEFGTDKARALLAYLAVEAGRPHRRAELATLLWPESPAPKAAHNLSQTLLRLRRALREEQPGLGQPFLLSSRQDIQFNPLSDHSLDVAECIELLRAHRQHQHTNAEACGTCIGWLRRAASLYRGDLLAGFSLRDSVPFEEWLLVQQEALHVRAVEALSALVAYHELHDEPAIVCEYARRLVTLEPWQDQAQIKLMAALAQCGHEAAALAQYTAYRRSLVQEFGMEPSTAATALYEQIQARQHDGQGDARTSAPVHRDERRQITALVCGRRDLQGLTDPEELLEALAHCSAHCDAAFARYGGKRQPRQGVECLVYFGYPVAYEDAARRAIHAGLAIVQAAQAADHSHAIGIHTGIMVAVEGQLAGNVPTVARGCQSLAEPNSVWVTAETERLAHNWFDCQLVDPKTLTNAAGPTLVYRVTGESAARHRPEWLAQRQHLPRLVGREPELQQLTACLEAVQQGSGQVIAVCGEAGIGKTRMVWELQHMRPWPGVWLETRCQPFFQNTSLYPVICLLEQFLGFQPGNSAMDKRVQLDRTLARFDLAEPIPTRLLALMLGLPTDTPAPQSITEDMRNRMREVCLALLSRATAEQPVVLVVEDLHWADPSSLAWLDASLNTLATLRCLTLLTYRSTFAPPWQPRPHLHHLTLGPLTPAQVEEMVTELAGDTALSTETRRRLVSQTDGIPLFVEELTRAVCEADAATHDGDIPTTLRDSLTARLDHMGAANETAQWAAVLGREFSYPLLVAVTAFDEGRLQDDLAALIKANLISTHGAAPQASFAFKHTLVQEAAYDALLKRTRQRYHRRIAETLETCFPQIAETQPEILAQHWGRAGSRARAVDYWLQAGKRTTAQGALQEARGFFDRALAENEPGDHERRWHALRGRQAVLFLGGERTAEQADLTALMALAQERNRPDWRAEVLHLQLRRLNALGEYQAMLPLADDTIAAARSANNPSLEARALSSKAAAQTRLNDPAAQQIAQDAVARGQAAGDDWTIAYATGMLALHAAYAGDYGETARLWTSVREMVQRCNDPVLESRALSNLGGAYQHLGLFDDARKHLEEGITLCDMIGDRHSRAYNIVNLGSVLLLSGRHQAARELFEQGLHEATALDDASLRAGELCELGRLAEMMGDYAGATGYLEEAQGIFAGLAMTAEIMQTDAVLAKCDLGQGRPEEGRRRATQVWDYLQEHGAAALGEAVETYLALADVFGALAETRGADNASHAARAILEAGHDLVMARAAKISDPTWRRSFLENVPPNRTIVERWQRLQQHAARPVD